jgi:hypothetical protein
MVAASYLIGSGIGFLAVAVPVLAAFFILQRFVRRRFANPS